MSHDRYPGRLCLPVSFPDRRFRIWSYVPSHSELVLRTEFEPDAPHIELLFKPVYQINLPVAMSGGLVVDIDDRVQGEAETVTFVVSNDRFRGHILADYLFLGQEQRSRYSPFSLFHGFLRSEFTR
ncbi:MULTISPECIES: hypothetical protein [Streptosporangium]|uniref:Uncharacterized protein n=1 Tax=Streptosporangium brasiliense TaxID=47480 RepID=A0ABT9R226_9ACTN|nr:hypothetical protein [Streptosporangium brasiliense]MDP9863278.1 hypothetical protein [Streptosporangium brasiliense]